MPHFVELPHGYVFDIEQVLYFRIGLGDTNPDIDNMQQTPSGVKDFTPVNLTIHFKNGDKLEIPEFERFLLDDQFFPALTELENGVINEPALFKPFVMINRAVDGLEDHRTRGIYFLQGEITKRIKIGYTTDLDTRQKAFQPSEPLRLVGFLDNAKPEQEKQIHERFSHLRVIGEWFEGSPEIINWFNEQVSTLVE